MSNALLASGREIYYAMCNWGVDSVWTWGLETANSWRVSSDVSDSWSSVVTIASNAQAYGSYAGPGGFNDFDMLEVGNGGLTTAEERAHFGIWAIAKSPLLIGTDLTKISNASLGVLLNTVSSKSLNFRLRDDGSSFLVATDCEPRMSSR
jgi:alpha-galactosidase